MLNEGLTKEPAERGRVFAQEYRDAIYHLLKVKIEMRKPELSEASTIFFQKSQHLGALENRAKDDSAELIEWIGAESTTRLSATLGDQLVFKHDKRSFMWRMPSWQIGEMMFGFAIGTTVDPRNCLLRDDKFWTGIAVWRNDLSRSGEPELILEAIKKAIANKWPYPKDLKSDRFTAMYRYINISNFQKIDDWWEEVFQVLNEMAIKLKEPLDAVAGTRDT